MINFSLIYISANSFAAENHKISSSPATTTDKNRFSLLNWLSCRRRRAIHFYFVIFFLLIVCDMARGAPFNSKPGGWQHSEP
jgi:hypothetical protein